MRFSRTDFVPLLAIVAGGVIGASFTFGALVSRSPADDVPVRSPDGQSSVFDECADDRAYRLLGWVDKCADVRVDGFDEEVYLSAAPVFTPMTVRPEITNRSEVQAALMTEYPPILREAGIGGTVVVWFFVSEEDSRRNAVLTERKASLLKRPAPYGKRSGVDHPVQRTVGSSFYDRGPAILKLRIPVLIRERDLGLRYVPVRIPGGDHDLSLVLRENFIWDLCLLV